MAVKDELSKSMSSFGYQIIQTLVTDIEPDHKVREAMNEINSAQRFRYRHGVVLATENSLVCGRLTPFFLMTCVRKKERRPSMYCV
jgi:hypothetical protein